MKTPMLQIVRVTENDGGTFGVMLVNNSPEFVTLEEPWQFNERNVSCIPAGLYKVHPYYSMKFGSCFEVRDVPGRTGILIHQGNTIDDTRGCILVGSHYGKISARSAILRSKAAMDRLLELLKGTPVAQLHIAETYHGGKLQ